MKVFCCLGSSGYSGCVARDKVIRLRHPVVRWTNSTQCSLCVNVGDCTKKSTDLGDFRLIQGVQKLFSTTGRYSVVPFRGGVLGVSRQRPPTWHRKRDRGVNHWGGFISMLCGCADSEEEKSGSTRHAEWLKTSQHRFATRWEPHSSKPTPDTKEWWGKQGSRRAFWETVKLRLEWRWLPPAYSYLVNGVKPVHFHGHLGPGGSPETDSWTRGHQPTWTWELLRVESYEEQSVGCTLVVYYYEWHWSMWRHWWRQWDLNHHRRRLNKVQ